MYYPVSSLSKKLPIIGIVQWSRFHWLLPFFWFLLMAFSVNIVLHLQKGKIGRWLSIVLCVSQIVLELSMNANLAKNYTSLVSELIDGKDFGKNKLNYSNFYDENLFSQIHQSIGRPKNSYRVISIGFFPEVTIYNGFCSLDSYQRNYNLDYKMKFRSIIEKELDRSDQLSAYFDDWGSRCYAFTSATGSNFTYGKNSKLVMNDLSLDLKVFWEMGGRYIFSAVPIENNPDILLHGVFSTEQSFWKIYVYRIAFDF